MTESSSGAPIFNAVLSYMRFNMISRDRLYIQDATCARFKLTDLKAAHKVLSLHCEPSLNYNVKGPHKGDREKLIFFFEETFKILVNLDRQNLTPLIACPAEELGKLLDMNGQYDLKLIEDRFQKYDDKLKNVTALESTINVLQQSVETLMKTAKYQPPSAVPPITKERLLSQIVNPALQHNRERSNSVSSLKRLRATDESDDESLDQMLEGLNTDFREPKYNLRNRKKQRFGQESKSSGNKVQSQNGVKTSVRRQANWGTGSTITSSRLAGTVPELFISNCRDRPEEADVKAYMDTKDVTVVGVKMMSPPESVKRSFKITVATFEDYDKILAGGQYLPRGVAVKKFNYPRSTVNRPQWSTSFVNHPTSHRESMDVSATPVDAPAQPQSVPTVNTTQLTPTGTDPNSAAAAQALTVS